MSALSWIMLLAAAAAVAVAMAAVAMGQFKTQKPKQHALEGIIGRRMGLFSNFASSKLARNVDRPQRVVEMTMSGDPTDAKYSGMV
jgi:hypothetical protein